MPTNVYAGTAKRTVTPSLATEPVYLAGFDANRRASAAHDDLYARACALRVIQEARPAATLMLVVCDLIGLLRAEVQAIEDAARAAAAERGLGLGTREVACTHTHFRPGRHYVETMSLSCHATPLLMEA